MKYTSEQVAAMFNKRPITIRGHALREGLGVLITPRLRLYSERDIEKFREIFSRPMSLAKSKGDGDVDLH